MLSIIGKKLHAAQVLFEQTHTASRVFKDFEYLTRKIWSKSRRAIGKAEHLSKGVNPRFVVTSLSAERIAAQSPYENLYCARGEMENRIKERQRFLFADRTSTHALRSNRLRLLFATMAHVLLKSLKEFGLKGASMVTAQVNTIRSKLLKIGGRIQVSVRRVVPSPAQAYPYQELFRQIPHQLRRPESPPLQLYCPPAPKPVDRNVTFSQ